ncbi:MAG TPA: glutamine-hydrolyzing carbamoyl-phosphate synthase small subunit [Candidatus Krumholzibacteria bacterium]|nr:glutamine-hydrolyzing carbamoyl-phosphate synthase small subunit [Candidatus Krumholzibacteria bacterium]HRX52318.1 glutamine-hydrolyzing carbamoyl-phosphate synthase small subunit [Candidatus Krumholzibacteria bacterium]
MDITRPALLALEDGTVWEGSGFGAPVDTVGEIVFNTSMTGYQEILTDPSYHRQLVTLTAVHVGNTGVNDEDDESGRIHAAALLVRDLSPVTSSWRASRSLDAWLRDHGVPGITGLETRALTRHLRDHGVMRAALSSVDPDPERLIAAARNAPEMNGADLASEVTCAAPYAWTEGGVWWRPQGAPAPAQATRHVVVYDFGVKRSILRWLVQLGCRVTVVPARTSAAEALALEPDGILLSNGPGDPAAVTYAIATVKELLGKAPLFGICLGHQILALALGGRTRKMTFGHRGGNQPVALPGGGRVEISAHNHGFEVDAASLPANVQVLRTHLSDGCCEGIIAANAFSVQYHPESAPGPHDSDGLFREFVTLMDGEVSAHARA